MDAILVEGLEKRYKEVQALAGISFSVRAGEVFALLGPNGAGKSTTVRVLCTLTHPDAGRAEVAGHDVARQALAVRKAIGYVPQDSGVDRYGTGRENLMLQGHVQGMGGDDLRARVGELFELVGIADAADRVVQGYSGGMRRRLDIALGLVHRPKVLFLDEPTTGLDPEARVQMWEEVERLGGAPENEIDGRILVSRIENGGRALPGILHALESEGIGVESVSVSRPSLDDVYLHYTGREFAAEDRGEA